MSDAQEMERFFRERGFGQLIGWGDSPALLVIDFTRAFTNPALPLGANLDRELAETVRVLGSARAAAIPIYYSSVCYEDKDVRDAGLWAKKIAGIATAIPDTPTQNAWEMTISRIRQRGMPRARKTAYSLSEATVAEYSVWLVTATPTSNPRIADQPTARPLLVAVSQYHCVWAENSVLQKAAMSG